MNYKEIQQERIKKANEEYKKTQKELITATKLHISHVLKKNRFQEFLHLLLDKELKELEG